MGRRHQFAMRFARAAHAAERESHQKEVSDEQKRRLDLETQSRLENASDVVIDSSKKRTMMLNGRIVVALAIKPLNCHTADKSDPRKK